MKHMILSAAKLILLAFSIFHFFNGEKDTAIYLGLLILIIDDAYRLRVSE